MTRRLIGACRSCAAPIIWAVTQDGRRAPIDAVPVDNGNIVLTGDGPGAPNATVVAPGTPGELYLSHFVTCKDGSSWRKQR